MAVNSGHSYSNLRSPFSGQLPAALPLGEDATHSFARSPPAPRPLLLLPATAAAAADSFFSVHAVRPAGIPSRAFFSIRHK